MTKAFMEIPRSAAFIFAFLTMNPVFLKSFSLLYSRIINMAFFKHFSHILNLFQISDLSSKSKRCEDTVRGFENEKRKDENEVRFPIELQKRLEWERGEEFEGREIFRKETGTDGAKCRKRKETEKAEKIKRIRKSKRHERAN
nr:hypothetical protein [Leptospira kmetyi]